MPPIITRRDKAITHNLDYLDIPDNSVIVAITGHRPDKLGNDYDLTSPLVKQIERILTHRMADLKPDFMISGMALGIDTIWAMLAIENNIPLIAAIPFTDQDCKWPDKSRFLYHSLLKKAYAIVNVSGQHSYKPEYMQLRNQWMVNKLFYNPNSRLIAVFDGSPGGTKNCVDYARQILRPEKITIINPQFIAA